MAYFNDLVNGGKEFIIRRVDRRSESLQIGFQIKFSEENKKNPSCQGVFQTSKLIGFELPIISTLHC